MMLCCIAIPVPTPTPTPTSCHSNPVLTPANQGQPSGQPTQHLASQVPTNLARSLYSTHIVHDRSPSQAARPKSSQVRSSQVRPSRASPSLPIASVSSLSSRPVSRSACISTQSKQASPQCTCTRTHTHAHAPQPATRDRGPTTRPVPAGYSSGRPIFVFAVPRSA